MSVIISGIFYTQILWLGFIGWVWCAHRSSQPRSSIVEFTSSIRPIGRRSNAATASWSHNTRTCYAASSSASQTCHVCASVASTHSHFEPAISFRSSAFLQLPRDAVWDRTASHRRRAWRHRNVRTTQLFEKFLRHLRRNYRWINSKQTGCTTISNDEAITCLTMSRVHIIHEG